MILTEPHHARVVRYKHHMGPEEECSFSGAKSRVISDILKSAMPGHATFGSMDVDVAGA